VILKASKGGFCVILEKFVDKLKLRQSNVRILIDRSVNLKLVVIKRSRTHSSSALKFALKMRKNYGPAPSREVECPFHT